jgi:hypothetical protein
LHSTQDVRDVSNDVGEMMSSAGLADILTPVEVNALAMRSIPYHSFNWTAREGDYDDGYQYAPALVWRCQTCEAVCYAHPMDKPAAQTTFHFEKQICPDDVYATYLKFFEAWQAKGKRKLKGIYERTVDAFRQRSNESMDAQQLRNLKDGTVVTL